MKWHVICLCAAWCGVCRDWQPVVRELARAHPEWNVAWIDVEDHDDEMGEVEVETFPTMLLARGSEAVFLGPVPPSAPQLEHLVDRLSPAPALQGVAAALLARLQPLLDPARV